MSRQDAADLLLELPGGGGRAAVAAAVRDAIRDGRTAVGSRLPSSRALAADLGVARNTVAEAYAVLVAEGWLVARRGSGTIVAPGARARSGQPAAAPPTRGPELDLSPGSPDLSAFPRSAWARAARRAIVEVPSTTLGYPDPRGDLGLRVAMAGHLGRSRGVRADPGHLVICSGYTQALSLLATALARGGAGTVAMESHGLTAHRAVVAAAGLAVRAIGVDEDGARVTELTDEDAVVLGPAHQFPLGVTLSPSRRSAVLAWAGRTGSLVVEDDYDGEFRWDRRRVGALQALGPDRVAHVGTASKCLVPAVGLAWLVVPPALADAVVDAKVLADGYTGVLEQLTLARLVEDGSFGRHVRRSALEQRRRRDHLVAVLAERCPGARVTGTAAGLHAVVRLSGVPASEEGRVVAAAADRGLRVDGLSRFRHVPDPAAGASLVVGYARPPAHDFARAVDVLAGVLAEVAHRTAPGLALPAGHPGS